MNVIRMKIVPINYAHLENREQQFVQIEKLIEAKRKMLLYKQQKILSELNTIKSSLDNIIKDTNDITTTLKEKKII